MRNHFLRAATSKFLYDTDAQTYITAVEAADGQTLETATKDAINAFVVGCKADGIWTAIKASCILAGARTLAGALVPLAGAAPTNNNFVTGDYNRKTGLVGDGSTKYLNSNRNNNADPQNSFHLALYASTITGLSMDYAGTYGAPSGSLLQRAGGSQFHYGYARSTAPVGGANASAGFIGVKRSSSTAIELRSGGTTSTASNSSVAPSSFPLYIMLRNDGGTPTSGTSRVAYYSIGETLDLALLSARVTALITAINVAF